ncbi:glucosyltransferase domain-containing protein [Pseudomonas sp. R5(2019)]|uniref:glucosyltransferase domain-containing protein n=1 Tax=Pseudomonas sp. R5(2019) TaxID=2697566 RepID=UPI001411E74B|nr:glucosyltransferase domain-containing protein [Pseudomonas sp. R5(2019)]NBA95047.1 hypothetical protein [Pseudomonas sp. R5(2019)]
MMGRNSLFDRVLSPRETLVLFAVAAFVFVYPLILADFFYIDDSWRSQLAGTGWREEGRWFNELFYTALTFTGAAPNIFPLPLLIATLAMAFALRRLTFHYFPQPTLSACLVVLPLWYSPYFLQNLSYQYDGPTMALSVVAMVYALTFQSRHRWLQILWPGVLIAVAMGFYQLSLNVFIGLCCIEVVRVVVERQPPDRAWRLALYKVGQLLAGGLVYYLTAYRFMTQLRQGLLGIQPDLFSELGTRLALVAARVGLLVNDGNRWLCLLLGVGAVVGWLWAVWRMRGQPRLHSAVALVFYLLSLPLILVCISGITLLFRDFNDGARTLMGLSSVLVLVLYLNHSVLHKIQPRLGLLLIVPVLCLLSFSYAYGRVLNVQKELTNTVLQQLSHDLGSHRELREAHTLYMLNIGTTAAWLPAARGSNTLMPALKYVLNINFFVLPEMLPRAGWTNVIQSNPPYSAAQLAQNGFLPLVQGRFYDLYALQGDGYIVMKPVTDAESYQW